MHVRIDAARERQPVLGIEDLLRLAGLDVGRKPRDLSVLDRDIEAVDRRLVGADDAGVLDDGVENLVHARHSLTSWALRPMPSRPAPSARCPRARRPRIPWGCYRQRSRL